MNQMKFKSKSPNVNEYKHYLFQTVLFLKKMFVFILDGEIQVTVNKYDKFNVHDPSPFIVEYASFAGYDNSPMEFYYNCSTANIKDFIKTEKLISKSRIDKTPQNITKHVHSEKFNSNPTIQKLNVQSHSNIELALLLLNIIILMITLITLCCVFSKFNEII